DALLPYGDGVLVELEEDAFAAVLGGHGPARPGRACQWGQAAWEVADAVHVVDAGEADQGVHLAEAFDREHAGDLRPQGVAPVAGGEGEAALGVLDAGADDVTQQVTPLGDEEVDRVPVAELLLLFLRGVGGGGG